MNDAPSARGRGLGLIVLAAAAAVLAFVRWRGAIPPYVALHRALARRGVPDAVRNLDDTVLMVLAPFLAAFLLRRSMDQRTGSLLGLGPPFLRPLAAAFACALPMFLAGAVFGDGPAWHVRLLAMAVAAPLVEELFFRGLLVGLTVRLGLPFWPVAAAAGLLFGLVHVPWRAPWPTGAVAVVLVTGAGGVFYAWLYRAWGWNLWMPIGLHAAMNLAWGLFRVAPDAVGPLGANVARAATITLAILVTLRRRAAVGSEG